MRKLGGEPYPRCFALTTCILSQHSTYVCLQNDQTFRKHLFTDLRPYVCTFEQCDLKLFPDRHTWFEHELECHRLEWCCHLCSHPPFTSESDFRKHMHARHAHFTSSGQLSALLQISKQPVDRIPAAACDLCDWETILRNSDTSNQADDTLVVTVEQFRRHLGSHMETLALFALPRNYRDEGENANTNEAARFAQSASSHQSSLEQRPLSWPTESSHEATQDGTVPDVEIEPRPYSPMSPFMSPLVSQSARPSLSPWSRSIPDCRPWTKNPFPRYGAAAPQVCSEEGDLYFHGGLVDRHAIRGDCGVIKMMGKSCIPIATSSEGPGSRVGAAALLVEKLFLVFGGDTGVDEGEKLDNALYAFNTSKMPVLDEDPRTNISRQERMDKVARRLRTRGKIWSHREHYFY